MLPRVLVRFNRAHRRLWSTRPFVNSRRSRLRPAVRSVTMPPALVTLCPWSVIVMLADLAGRFNPLMLAVLIGWVLLVCKHEFAHALVAYIGGDRSVRQRGYLSNPLNYIHPIYSILMPLVFLAMGGIPLPGAAVMIEEGSLRRRGWRSLVSLAGPLSDLAAFLVLAAVIHPAVGLVDASGPDVPMWAYLIGVLMFLEGFVLVLNLLPIPPLDGFNTIAPYLPRELVWRLRQPQVSMTVLVVFFITLWRVPGVAGALATAVWEPIMALGLDPALIGDGLAQAFG